MMSLLSNFGPIGLMFLATAWLLKVMVADKLKVLQATLNELKESLADHEEKLHSQDTRITAMETAMRINGCMDRESKPRCAQ